MEKAVYIVVVPGTPFALCDKATAGSSSTSVIVRFEFFMSIVGKTVSN
jgi:hypothetical protein